LSEANQRRKRYNLRRYTSLFSAGLDPIFCMMTHR